MKKSILIILIIIFFSILFFSIFNIFKWFKDNSKIEELSNQISDIKIEERQPKEAINVNPPLDKSDDYWDYIKMDMINVDFNDLLKKNKNTVGWIKVNGTNINYPFVQTNNNDYYLHHAYDNSYNQAGWIFLDYRNNIGNLSRNTVIYGHGRLNTTMFGSLKNILTSDWLDNKDNYVVKLSTPLENTLWQVFSVYNIKSENYYITTDFNDDEFNQFLTTLVKRSKYDFKTNVNVDDKILTLSTCQNDYGYRIVMHAKLIKKETKKD